MGGVVVCRGQACLVMKMTPEVFSKALLRNHHAFLRTASVERMARALSERGFEESLCVEFVKAVCLWGNRPGTAGLVFEKNTKLSIKKKLQAAAKAISRSEVGNALDLITSISGLGISFGSKHLRMLEPDKAVVLDSVICEGLGYPTTRPGYEEFVADCTRLRNLLNESESSPNPIDIRGSWRLADVEMALYSMLRGL